jgi:hypothetical protein
MKALPRYIDKAHSALLIGRSVFYLAAGLFLLLIAGTLAYALIDSAVVLLFIPACIGAKGGSLVLQALQPFSGQRASSPPRTLPEDRAGRVRRGRQSHERS